jgi:UPF0271 protein
VIGMVTRGVAEADDGAEIQFKPDSICLHGDTAEAVDMARIVRRALEVAGVSIKPMGEKI